MSPRTVVLEFSRNAVWIKSEGDDLCPSSSSKLRSKFCFLTPNPTNLENILDAAKISDTIIYVISSSKGISIEGDYLLDLINLHCLPGSVIYTLINSSDDDDRMSTTTTTRLSVSRDLEKFLEKRFSNVKMTPLDTEQDGQRLLRKLIEQKLVQATKRCLRPYLFGQSFAYENPQVILLLLH